MVTASDRTVVVRPNTIGTVGKMPVTTCPTAGEGDT